MNLHSFQNNHYESQDHLETTSTKEELGLGNNKRRKVSVECCNSVTVINSQCQILLIQCFFSLYSEITAKFENPYNYLYSEDFPRYIFWCRLTRILQSIGGSTHGESKNTWTIPTRRSVFPIFNKSP